jgi:hypothetical protein
MSTPQDALAAAQASWNAGDLDAYLELWPDGPDGGDPVPG